MTQGTGEWVVCECRHRAQISRSQQKGSGLEGRGWDGMSDRGRGRYRMGRDGTRQVGMQMNPRSRPGRRDVVGRTLSAGRCRRDVDCWRTPTVKTQQTGCCGVGGCCGIGQCRAWSARDRFQKNGRGSVSPRNLVTRLQEGGRCDGYFRSFRSFGSFRCFGSLVVSAAQSCQLHGSATTLQPAVTWSNE